MKSILTDLAIGLTLIAVGFAGGFLYTQTATLNRCQEVLNADTFQYSSGDLYYIACGEKLQD